MLCNPNIAPENYLSANTYITKKALQLYKL
jgi:hypothetical protein